VYGVSAWDVTLDGADQCSLIITPDDEAVIVVDNLEIAQFIRLLVDNVRIRSVIDSITTRVVLILGRFTAARKRVLEMIQARCRDCGLVPILFDFEKPSTRNLTETITTLARLSRFIVVDMTDARCVPLELQAVVPHLPSVPVQPILLKGSRVYGMFSDFKDYPWVLPMFKYDSERHVARAFKTHILKPVQRYQAAGV
jgi:hypothetical protein